MKSKPITRPWQPLRSYGNRVKRNKIYQTSRWKYHIRPSFLAGTTPWEGKQIPNTLCIMCYKQGTITPTHTVDHIVAIEDGGSEDDHANLQGLCFRHHQQKSAIEGNNRRKR